MTSMNGRRSAARIGGSTALSTPISAATTKAALAPSMCAPGAIQTDDRDGGGRDDPASTKRTMLSRGASGCQPPARRSARRTRAQRRSGRRARATARACLLRGAYPPRIRGRAGAASRAGGRARGAARVRIAHRANRLRELVGGRHRAAQAVRDHERQDRERGRHEHGRGQEPPQMSAASVAKTATRMRRRRAAPSSSRTRSRGVERRAGCRPARRGRRCSLIRRRSAGPNSCLRENATRARPQQVPAGLASGSADTSSTVTSRARGRHAPRRLDAVHVRHPHVHDHDVRLGRQHELDGLRARAGLARPGEAGGRVDDLASRHHGTAAGRQRRAPGPARLRGRWPTSVCPAASALRQRAATLHTRRGGEVRTTNRAHARGLAAAATRWDARDPGDRHA